jgi:hypothetical protein
VTGPIGLPRNPRRWPLGVESTIVSDEVAIAEDSAFRGSQDDHRVIDSIRRRQRNKPYVGPQ